MVRVHGGTSVTAALGGVEVPEEDPRGVLNRLLFLPRSLIGCRGASLAVQRVRDVQNAREFELEMLNGRKIRRPRRFFRRGCRVCRLCLECADGTADTRPQRAPANTSGTGTLFCDHLGRTPLARIRVGAAVQLASRVVRARLNNRVRDPSRFSSQREAFCSRLAR